MVESAEPEEEQIDDLIIEILNSGFDDQFIILALDAIDSINKMHSLEKKSFQYRFLHVHMLGNMNKMCEVLQGQLTD